MPPMELNGNPASPVFCIQGRQRKVKTPWTRQPDVDAIGFTLETDFNSCSLSQLFTAFYNTWPEVFSLLRKLQTLSLRQSARRH